MKPFGSLCLPKKCSTCVFEWVLNALVLFRCGCSCYVLLVQALVQAAAVEACTNACTNASTPIKLQWSCV